VTIPVEQSDALTRLPGISHGFFGRRGGVSTGIHASLNVSEKSGDDPAHVSANRAAALALLNFSTDNLATLNQVHSARVHVLSGTIPPGNRPEGDAMVTNVPGLALGILTADCTPILLADAEAGVIGAAHAGWKGAASDIVYATVMAMVALGADPAKIVAAIGPTISLANYEVGPEFAADLLAKHPYAASRIAKPDLGREHFDLAGLVFDQLRGAGVGSVDDLKQCTYAAPDRYFSHRYATHQNTTTGRQISIIGLR
jgi:YfiH family protein